MADVIHMAKRWEAGELGAPPALGGIELRALVPGDAEDLGRLLWSGFGPSGLDEFASERSARDEAHATLAGKWGAMIWTASVLAATGQAAIAASVVYLRDNGSGFDPLLAFLVTDPAHQRRGIGTSVLGETLLRIDALGFRELHLAVTPENPARTLYQRLGFLEKPSSREPTSTMS